MEAIVRLKSSFHWKPSTCMAFLSLLLARNPFFLSPSRSAGRLFSVAPRTVSLALPLSATMSPGPRGGDAESKDTLDSRGKIIRRALWKRGFRHALFVCALGESWTAGWRFSSTSRESNTRITGRASFLPYGLRLVKNNLFFIVRNFTYYALLIRSPLKQKGYFAIPTLL